MSNEICERCGRRLQRQPNSRAKHLCPAYAYVVHDHYGCDTGCCGHCLYLCAADDTVIETEFEFTHPYGDDDADIREWVMEFAHKHNVPVDWDQCNIVDC